MKLFFLSVILVLLGTQVLAQPASGVLPAPEHQSQREQRRAELRSALMAPGRTQRQEEEANAQGAKRQLSAQERSELRQQLRQQQGAGRHRP